MNNTVAKEDPSKWPWGTLIAVLATIVLCITSAFDPDKLGYDDLSTMIVLAWGAMALGRGLAAKNDPAAYVEYGPITRWLNSFNWATVGVGAFAIVGYVIQLGDTPMSWQEYAQKVGILSGALLIGRGVSVLKKDTTTGVVPTGAPHDLDIEITDANLESVTSDAGVPSEPIEPDTSDLKGDDANRGMPIGFDKPKED